MKAKHYDIIIIGAGIHGAGVAQAAAAKGYSVLILEKEHIAYGTSSRSSKLIHGGLRYLETLQFSLVRECLQERDTLLKIAPKLVTLKPFFFPVYKQSSRRSWQLRLGLSLYAALGLFRSNSLFRKIPLQSWDNRDDLRSTELEALFQYQDAVTNDVALTEAVIASAQKFGAKLIVPGLFSDASMTPDGWTVHYRENNQQQQCQADLIVNAAGPWVNTVLDKFSPQPRTLPVDLVQGTHIRINVKLKHGIYYLESPIDRRGVFAIPWGEQTMIGTTETKFTGSPDDVQPLESEISYLLDTYKYYFPSQKKLSVAQVETAFAGLRVLPTGAKPSFLRTRDIKLLTDQTDKPRLITIYGGKLTAYRATADKVLKKIARCLPAPSPDVDTQDIIISPS